MKNIIKKVVKVLCFVIIFAILFSLAQVVLHYRWSSDEDIYTRNLDFESQPKNSIDVLYFGTSEVYADISPIVTYGSEGITGYNFAVSFKSAVTTYYQLLYALKHQTPKVVVCDFESLFEDELPSDNEPLYRKIVETMPDDEIKNQLIDEIMKLDGNQDYLSWKFPLLRYHSLWSELDESNFKMDYKFDDKYKQYQKGSLMKSDNFSGDIYRITPDLWESEKSEEELSEISVKYYDMFIQECQRRDIKVSAVMTPKIYSSKKFSSRWQTIKEYFDSRSVDYLNYNDYEQISRMKLNFKDHYYDAAHLNTFGSIIFSKTLASDLKNKYGLINHKGDESYKKYWDDAYELFKQEIPSQQPSLKKCISVMSELDMKSLIYINDKNAMNYEKYSEALVEPNKSNEEEILSAGIVVVKNNDRKIINSKSSESYIEDLGKINTEINDENTKSLIINGNEIIKLEDAVDLYVLGFSDGNIVSTVKF